MGEGGGGKGGGPHLLKNGSVVPKRINQAGHRGLVLQARVYVIAHYTERRDDFRYVVSAST